MLITIFTSTRAGFTATVHESKVYWIYKEQQHYIKHTKVIISPRLSVHLHPYNGMHIHLHFFLKLRVSQSIFSLQKSLLKACILFTKGLTQIFFAEVLINSKHVFFANSQLKPCIVCKCLNSNHVFFATVYQVHTVTSSYMTVAVQMAFLVPRQPSCASLVYIVCDFNNISILYITTQCIMYTKTWVYSCLMNRVSL